MKLLKENVEENFQTLGIGKYFLIHKSTKLKKIKIKNTLHQDENPPLQKRPLRTRQAIDWEKNICNAYI